MKSIATYYLRRNFPLPYSNILTLIFKWLNVPFTSEELVKESVNVIDEFTLLNMTYEKIGHK